MTLKHQKAICETLHVLIESCRQQAAFTGALIGAIFEKSPGFSQKAMEILGANQLLLVTATAELEKQARALREQFAVNSSV